jgi:ABC-type oligopeptide transport system substrate-binding subunit
MTESASQQIDRHVFRRLTSFADVGRFMVAWLLLLVVLIAGVVYQTRGLSEYYLSTQSVPGGLVSEGIIGTYTNPNPIFASSTIDLSVSRLLFNSILTYDDKGALVNDLAETVTRSQDGLIYTVTLRKGHSGTTVGNLSPTTFSIHTEQFKILIQSHHIISVGRG